MPAFLSPVLVLFAVPLAIIGWLVAAYNGLISKRVETQNA